jgi:hypothetical protein
VQNFHEMNDSTLIPFATSRNSDDPSSAIDWRKRAQEAWNDPGWRQAAADYHRARGQRTLVVEIEPERLARLRRLMADDISLDRVWREINDPGPRPTTQSTVNALLYQLRMDGLAAFEHPNCRRRLAQLSAEQLRELIAALIRVRAKSAIVTDELLIALDRIRRP